MASTPKMEYQVCIFQNNSAVATLGLKVAISKFVWKIQKKSGIMKWVGRHTSFPPRQSVNDIQQLAQSKNSPTKFIVWAFCAQYVYSSSTSFFLGVHGYFKWGFQSGLKPIVAFLKKIRFLIFYPMHSEERAGLINHDIKVLLTNAKTSHSKKSTI